MIDTDLIIHGEEVIIGIQCFYREVNHFSHENMERLCKVDK